MTQRFAKDAKRSLTTGVTGGTTENTVTVRVRTDVCDVSVPDRGCAPNCFFRRLRKFHDDEVLLGIEIVLAGLVNHANLVELGRSFIGDDLVELPQLERSSIVLVLHTDDESRVSSLHWISRMRFILNSCAPMPCASYQCPLRVQHDLSKHL